MDWPAAAVEIAEILKYPLIAWAVAYGIVGVLRFSFRNKS